MARQGADGGGLRIDVLGPLRVEIDGVEVDVPGPRRRAVLALLVLAAGRTVSVDALLDAVWPEATPESGRRALHSHVSRLRGHLGPHADLLERDGHGYRLRAEQLSVDVVEVRRGLDGARGLVATDPAGAATALGELLSAWRGAALEEFPDIEPLAADAVALASLRADLTDDWLDARIAAGGDPDLHRDAARAARDAPLRERTTALLMRALAAEGRQSEAMRVAHEFRRLLAEETGFDPTPSFAELENLVASGALVVTTVPPAAPAAPAPRASQPRRRARPTTPMVGRHHELAAVLRTVESATLVTIVGPGGVGKTRLALEAAADIADAAARDVHVVELATIEDERHTLDALGVALGLRAPDPDALREAAHAVLSSGRAVLVVDNCEHLVGACRDLIDDLLDVVDELTVLATSREPLDLPQEHLIRLGPLPVPDAGASLADVGDAPAVEAFVAHVRRRDPEFALTPANASVAAEVVRRLDGLPLALELAAGRVASLGIDDVRDRLGRALDLLGSGRTSADARHRTLRSTIDWSYRLLEEDERAVVRSLAVFPAGLGLDGVEELALRRGTTRDAAALVARLVDASVLVTDTSSGRTRFRLLETVRAFAQEDAVAVGDRDALDDHLLGTMLDLVSVLARGARGPNEKEVNERFSSEFPNLRAARDVAVERGDLDWLVATAIELHDLGTYRDFAEAHVWTLDAAQRALTVDHRSDTALLLGAASRSAWLCGRFEDAQSYGRRALELATDDRQREFAHDALGIVALFYGDFARCEELQLLAATSPGTKARGSYHATAALAAAYAGNLARADELLAVARVECDLSGSISDRSFARYTEAEVLSIRDVAASIPVYEDAIAMAQGIGASFVEGIANVGLASALARVGRHDDALHCYRWLVDYFRRAGNWTQLWTALRNLAAVLAAKGDARGALTVLAAVQHAMGVAEMAPDVAADQVRLRREVEAALGPAETAAVVAHAASLVRSRVVEEVLATIDAALG